VTLQTARLPQKPPHSTQGFTLVELLVVVALLAIVLSFAVPNLRNMMTNNRAKTTITALVNALQMARNEAVSRNTSITFCAANDTGTDCSNSQGAYPYQHGAMLMLDNGTKSEILHRTETFPDLTAIATAHNKLRFKSTGSLADGNYHSWISISGDNLERTICIGALGQIHTAQGTGADKCRQP